MKRCGVARRGIHMSDGIFNVALLKKEKDEERIGLSHFGMWVDDLDEAEKKVLEAGGEYLSGGRTSPKSFYEAKYRDPTGIVFDLTHTGWAGSVKDVVPKTLIVTRCRAASSAPAAGPTCRAACSGPRPSASAAGPCARASARSSRPPRRPCGRGR